MPSVNPPHKNSKIIHISDTNNPRILVIGIGNIYRSDDAAGLEVVQHLKRRATKNAVIIEGNGDGAELMDYWKNSHAVILIDAVSSGAIPGTVHRFDVHTQTIPRFINFSTHSFSVADAIELARVLNQLPRYFIIYGIEGKHFAVGTELSAEVKGAIQEAVIHILKDISSFTHSCHL